MEKRMEYKEENIERIYQNLKNAHSQGTPIEYEIRLDSFISVRRTSDLALFDLFRHDLHELTEQILFIFYRGKSQHSDKYSLIKASDNSAFKLTTEDERLQLRIQAFEREKKAVAQKRRLKRHKSKIRKLKCVIHTQDSLITELQTKQSFDFKELVPLLSQLSSQRKDETSTESNLGGIPLSTILDELKRIEEKYGKERVLEGVMILLELLPNEGLLEKVKQTIAQHGK